MFGSKIKQLRRDRCLTQIELAQKMNVSQAAVAGWEKNVNFPNVSTLQELARFFGVSTDYLLGNDNPHFNSSETTLVENYRRLSDVNKRFINTMIHTLATQQIVNA